MPCPSYWDQQRRTRTFYGPRPPLPRKLFGLSAPAKRQKRYKRTVKYGALTWKARGVDDLAQYMSKAGNNTFTPIRFDWDEEPSQLGFDLSTALGAAHGLEIAFAFNDFEGGFGIDYIYPHDDNQAALANSMTSYWSEFAHNGSPMQGRDGNEPMWVSWGMGGMQSLVLDTPATKASS